MTKKFGPGYPGNTQKSTSQDPGLPTRPNQGDPCFNNPETPLRGRNEASLGTTRGVQSQAGVNKPGRGTKGRPAGPTTLSV